MCVCVCDSHILEGDLCQDCIIIIWFSILERQYTIFDLLENIVSLPVSVKISRFKMIIRNAFLITSCRFDSMYVEWFMSSGVLGFKGYSTLAVWSGQTFLKDPDN